MLGGIGNLLSGGNQSSLGTLGSVASIAGNLTGNSTLSTLGTVGQLAGTLGGGNSNGGLLGGLLGGNSTGSVLGGLGNLLSGGAKCTQNEQRLMQEKQQRNLLRKYLTQQTGDPIQSALISNTIPGKGALDDFDVGLGSRANVLQQLGASGGLLGNNSTLSSLANVGSLANLANSANNSNPGLLSSLVSLAGTQNNNSNILSSLGGLGTGLLGGGSNSGGLLGSIQSGVDTLNTINKVGNAVSAVKNLF